jgi:hypothetical protein
MQPAKRVIQLFDGVRPLARALKVDPSVVSRWQAPRDRRGQGGLIPAVYQGPLLRLAKRMRIALSADDLVQK